MNRLVGWLFSPQGPREQHVASQVTRGFVSSPARGEEERGSKAREDFNGSLGKWRSHFHLHHVDQSSGILAPNYKGG